MVKARYFLGMMAIASVFIFVACGGGETSSSEAESPKLQETTSTASTEAPAQKAEEPKKEEPKPEPKKEEPKAEPKKEEPKPEPKKEEPKPEPEPLAPYAGLAVTCEDKTTHTYCISPDLATPPDGKPTDPWGTKLDYSPEIFCGSDVSDRICLWYAKSVVATFQEYGLYAPTEYWVVGGDVEANNVGLAGVYCDRRVARDQAWGKDKAQCLAEENDPNGHRMDYYRRLSYGVINEGKNFNSASLSGDAPAGYMKYYSSVSPGFYLLDQGVTLGPGTKYGGISGEIDQKIVFHEGYHSFQGAHIATMDDYNTPENERSDMRGPTWFNEGSAEWMAYVGMFSALENRKLDLVTTELGIDSKFSFEKEMSVKMVQGKANMAQNCPGQGIKDLSYSNACYSNGNPVVYSLGAWAVAYLHDKKGSAFSTEFYGQLEELGWEGAFVATFGISSEEFYVEFDEFLELSWSEQKAILPDYD